MLQTTKQTAYSSGRVPRQDRDKSALSGWDPAIGCLYSAGHNFLELAYSDSGFLFRGAASGLEDLVISGKCGHFAGSHSVTALEQELNIYLITQDLSDACTVSRFWEIEQENYIAVFRSEYFNRELERGRAAVLGFAEPGVVFKYPFFTRPVSIDDIEWLFVSPQDYSRFLKSVATESSEPGEYSRGLRMWAQNGNLDKVIGLDAGDLVELNRSFIEQAIQKRLESMGAFPATPVSGNHKPSRKK